MSDHPHKFARWHKQNPGVKAPYKAWTDLGRPDVPDGPASHGPHPLVMLIMHASQNEPRPPGRLK